MNLDLEESKTLVEAGDNVAMGGYSRLPFSRSAVLKHVLRTMHRMMQTSGTSEGLRTLIDSSLTRSVKKIMENRGLFGPAIFAIGEPIFLWSDPLLIVGYYSNQRDGNVRP